MLAGLRHQVGLDLPPLEEGRAGDPGLFGPGSEVWHIGRERILLLGGPAALLLQLAHPLVAAGVAEHSGFPADPFDRLRATLDATLRISFGDGEQVEEAASRVAATHHKVQGTLPAAAGPFRAGSPYAASDPALAMWVFATLVSVALDVYRRFVGPLSWSRCGRYYQEARRFARLFGVTDEILPATYGGFRQYVGRMEQGELLVVSDDARNMARDVLGPPLPALLRLSRPAANAVTAWLLPLKVRRGFGLRWGPAERAVAGAVRTSVRATIRGWPPSLRYWEHYRAACRRVGMAPYGE
ncbi:MAG: oxygenase MpaB family protein [Actinomycetota bacterium]